MNVEPCAISGVQMLSPRVFTDNRGHFLEVFQAHRYREAGIAQSFVQTNQSHSRHGVLRGLHYQIERPQGKLVWVVQGEIFDVIVDLRRLSPTFGQWWGTTLSGTNHRQLWVPPGLAHGFLVLSSTADVLYQCTDFWSPSHERTIVWNDATLAIRWPETPLVVAEKDAHGRRFDEAPVFDVGVSEP